MKRLLYMIRNQLCVIGVIVLLFIIVVSGNKSGEIITYNVSSVNSIEAVHLVSKYNPEVVETVYANNISEVVQLGPDNPVNFSGKLTAYGPDCVGCSGFLSCPPRHDARRGNIYFNDNQYGAIRIVAADANIPCGTMVKISNQGMFQAPVMAIVLDRGGAIKGTKMDLLFETEKNLNYFSNQSVAYEIVRWGW